MLEILIYLCLAALCGSIAQALVGYSHTGCLVSIAVGLIGVLIGTWLARQIGLPDILTINVDGRPFPVVWSIIGGALFAAVIALISRPRRPLD